MTTPLFSIIIPTYNEEKFLPRLLDSLVCQTVKNFEVLVIDGPSTDRTRVVARQFFGKLPSLSLHTVKRGSPPQQRNIGANNANGKWLVFMDADSECIPATMERLDVLCQKHETKFATTWFLPDTQKVTHRLMQHGVNIGLDLFRILKRPLAPGPLMIVERSTFKESGGFDMTQGYGDDYELSLRLGKYVPLHIFHEPLCIMSYRRIRRDGLMKTLKTYAWTDYQVFRTGKVPSNVPEYITGGAGY